MNLFLYNKYFDDTIFWAGVILLDSILNIEHTNTVRHSRGHDIDMTYSEVMMRSTG